jgi:transposase
MRVSDAKASAPHRSGCCAASLTTLKLLVYIVLEETARSAADILAIQPNAAMLIYRKIRLVISHHLERQATEIFDGVVELDESHFGGVCKGKRVVVVLARWSCSEY